MRHHFTADCICFLPDQSLHFPGESLSYSVHSEAQEHQRVQLVPGPQVEKEHQVR